MRFSLRITDARTEMLIAHHDIGKGAQKNVSSNPNCSCPAVADRRAGAGRRLLCRIAAHRPHTGRTGTAHAFAAGVAQRRGQPNSAAAQRAGLLFRRGRRDFRLRHPARRAAVSSGPRAFGGRHCGRAILAGARVVGGGGRLVAGRRRSAAGARDFRRGARRILHRAGGSGRGDHEPCGASVVSGLRGGSGVSAGRVHLHDRRPNQ